MNKTKRTLLLVGVLSPVQIIVALCMHWNLVTLIIGIPFLLISYLCASKLNKDWKESEVDIESFMKSLDKYNDKYLFKDQQTVRFISKTSNIDLLREMLSDWDMMNEVDPLEEEHNSNVLGITLSEYRRQRAKYEDTLKQFINKRIDQLK